MYCTVLYCQLLNSSLFSPCQVWTLILQTVSVHIFETALLIHLLFCTRFVSLHNISHSTVTQRRVGEKWKEDIKTTMRHISQEKKKPHQPCAIAQIAPSFHRVVANSCWRNAKWYRCYKKETITWTNKQKLRISRKKSSIIMEPGYFTHCNNHYIKTTHIFH